MGTYLDGRRDWAGEAVSGAATHTSLVSRVGVGLIVKTVCHVITKLELGGAQEVALYTVAHLDRTRFHAALVSGPGGLLTKEAEALPNVQLSIVPSLGRSINPWHDCKALIHLFRHFKRIQPSIVHTHSSKAGILGRLAAWLAGVPVIIHTIHGYGITPKQPWWLRLGLILLERLTGLITTHWIAVSQVDLTKGIAWRLFRCDEVSLIRPGIDPTPFLKQLDSQTRTTLRAELGATSDHWLVGTVACLKPQKAPQDFIAVAKLVCDAVPHARFVLIGDGELRPQVEALIRKYGLEGRCYLTGWRRDVPNVMQALDAFLLTSHWEGLPRVLLEARTVGIPIVATRAGGAEETFVNGRQAWLCHPGDVETMSQHLCSLFQSRHLVSRPARTGKNNLPKEFQLDEMVKQYESLYERFLHRRENHFVRQAA